MPNEHDAVRLLEKLEAEIRNSNDMQSTILFKSECEELLTAVRAIKAERDSLKRQVDQQAARIAELEAGLKQAIDDIQHWSGYASEYFHEKHDLQGDLTRIHALLKGDTALRGERTDNHAA